MAPKILILTHHKCASNWLRAICQRLGDLGLASFEVVGGRPQQAMPDLPRAHITLYVNAPFPLAHDPASFDDCIHFVRDPRDALVSMYWSWRYSHQNNDPEIEAFRVVLNEQPVEAGLLTLLDHFRMARQIETWPDAMADRARLIRYEDLLADFPAAFRHMMTAVEPASDEAVVDDVAAATAFDTITGRSRGTEDPLSHFRKGQPGDFQNYFSAAVARAFYDRYDWLGPRLGYW